jgi:osmotically-inducible protein OsmY
MGRAVPVAAGEALSRNRQEVAEPGLPRASDDFLIDEVDAALVDRVAERLIAEAEIRGRLVRVIVQNSVVILEGSVDSAAVKAAAGRLAWATPGVFDVCNMLVADR